MAEGKMDAPSRKEQILQVAREFFYSRGYERTSIQEIIDRVGIAKGTFYHYFSSKTDLLDAVVARMFSAAMSGIIPEIHASGSGATEKFRKLFRSIALWKMHNRELFRELITLLYRDENIVLRHRMMTHSIALLIPVLENIIRQGVEEGEFHVESPFDSAMVILNLSSAMGETIGTTMTQRMGDPHLAEDISRSIRVHERAIERILGAREGTLKIFQLDLIDQFI